MRLSDIDKERPDLLEDLNSVDRNITEMAITPKTKGIKNMAEFNPESLWLVCINQKLFDQIIEHVNPKFLHIYGCTIKDLQQLETLKNLETCIIIWNSKLTNLWDISKNESLKNLHLEDVSKLTDLKDLSKAQQLSYLGIEGGMHKPIKYESLSPLENLNQLNHLRLMNFKVKEEGLKALAKLKGLKDLSISNQFKTEEYAWLSTQLKNTKCNAFQAYSAISMKQNGELIYDTMITGMRKPLLLASKDQDKIDKYTQEFNALVKKFEEE